MDNDRDPDRAQILYRPVKDFQRVAPPDKFCCFRMDRLQSQLHPDRFDPVQPGEQREHIGTQTVGPGGYR